MAEIPDRILWQALCGIQQPLVYVQLSANNWQHRCGIMVGQRGHTFHSTGPLCGESNW